MSFGMHSGSPGGSTAAVGAPQSLVVPRVTVVVRTRDLERFVAQALDSALRQETVFPYEILVTDDASTDGTREILESYARSHPHVVRLLLRDRWVGNTRNLLDAFKETRADLVAVLDGDDYWIDSQYLGEAVAILDSEPAVTAVVAEYLCIDEEGEPLARKAPRDHRRDFTTDVLLHGKAGGASTLVFRKKQVLAPLEMCPWDGERSVDWLLEILASRAGAVRKLDSRVAAYRKRRGAVWSGLDTLERLEAVTTFYGRVVRYLDAPEQRMARRLGVRTQIEMARLLARAGRRNEARRQVMHALGRAPWEVVSQPGSMRMVLEAVSPRLFQRVRRLKRSGVSLTAPVDGEGRP